MLDILIEKNGTLYPAIIKTDFEQSAITAFSRAFPETRISGCLFHLAQAIYRKLPEFNLHMLYNTCFLTRKYTRMLTTLAFVDQNCV